MAKRPVTVTDDLGVRSRKVPIRHTLISATSLATANVFYTVRDGVAFEVNGLSVVNTIASGVALTVHAVHPDETQGTGTIEISQMTIPGNSAVDLSDLIGGMYETGTELKAFAANANVLNIHGRGSEIL